MVPNPTKCLTVLGRQKGRTTIKTTLANLFEALQEEAPPGDDRLVMYIVTAMLADGRLKYA